MNRQRASRFIGIDLGGGRGKTTALCELTLGADGGANVTALNHRAGAEPLHDDALWSALAHADPTTTVVAIAAPLTQAACERCPRPTCPGTADCEEPSVAWMREHSSKLLHGPQHGANAGTLGAGLSRVRPLPYLHRATELHTVYRTQLLSPSSLSGAGVSIRGRALQVRRRLAGRGFVMNQSMIEVSPMATVAALCGPVDARGYKRDADPWRTRALVLARFEALRFAPTSRFAREEVLQSDHRFDALICAYTAYLRQHQGWQIPAEFADFADDDGWIWTPPSEPRKS